MQVVKKTYNSRWMFLQHPFKEAVIIYGRGTFIAKSFKAKNFSYPTSFLQKKILPHFLKQGEQLDK